MINMKGISAFVATILLIALTVGVGGLVSVWIVGFTENSSDIVSEEGENQILCIHGRISLSDMKYCNGNISGRITNTGRITLGNITLQIIYQNATFRSIILNDTAGVALALKVNQISTFNQTVHGTNYEKIWVYTNCTGVTDIVSSGDVVSC